jgi:hypothetical protein
MADILRDEPQESSVDNFADRVLFGRFVRDAWEGSGRPDFDQPARTCGFE